ncbi:MAG: fibronectin type III domain-containing protein [Butyribacter sp.]|nr:fibronectin type III domain-containing protein [bacterium]MDY3854975.1 fibronectin type III domain-containing protein [Butyribacter sp.]
MMLNTQETNVAEHKQFMEEAIEQNKDCKWRIVTLHQDIYGSAEHSNEPEITNLRYTLVPYFEENDVDVVLTGHDHAYSRSQLLKGGKKTTSYTEGDADEVDDKYSEQFDKDIETETSDGVFVSQTNILENTTDEAEKAYLEYINSIMDTSAVVPATKDQNTVVNPEGILYMTANSSSGSKYYDLVGRKQSYIANRWQEDVPTYSVIDMTEDSFTINTYRTDTDEKIDDTFTIKKGAEESSTPVENPENKPAAKEDISKATVSGVKDVVYTGKEIKQNIVVKDASAKVLKEGTDYSVAYKDNKKAGVATITVTGLGNYTGTKTVSFSIKPPKTTLKKVTAAGSKKAKVQFAKSKASVSGYQIVYSTSSKFKAAKKVTTKKTSYTLKKLKKGKKYYVKVRAYKTVDGKKIYGAYSAVKKIKIKK